MSNPQPALLARITMNAGALDQGKQFVGGIHGQATQFLGGLTADHSSDGFRGVLRQQWIDLAAGSPGRPPAGLRSLKHHRITTGLGQGQSGTQAGKTTADNSHIGATVTA